jgi:peroxiredoxin
MAWERNGDSKEKEELIMPEESNSLSLKDRIAKFTRKMSETAPAEVIETLGSELRKLAESGIVRNALQVGAKAPDFSLPEARGGMQSLSSLLSKGPVVVTFYRGGWCPLLSDLHNKVARQYGLVFELSYVLKELQKGFGNPLPKFNGDDSWELPMPGTFVLDVEGFVRLAHVDPDYMRRLEPATMLDSLQAAR